MALPIKPKDTQEGCNPISSNCIVWQGPDIPCIELCNGDSVSDVVAKLAEELCTIADQLNISLLDLSCFGTLSPTPQNFRDVVNLLITKICNIENADSGGVSSIGCPDDCLVSVATCLQSQDALGNTITELPLKDYLILIGNRVCTIISQINTLTSAVTDLQNRVSDIEGQLANPALPAQIEITSGNCIGNGATLTIQAFVLALETAFCRLSASVGTESEINAAISQQCLVDGQPLDNAEQLSRPGSNMSSISGWVAGGSYGTLADAVNNLWLTVCDMRAAVADMQATLATCCGATCDDVNWNFTATGVDGVKNLTLYFTGSVPAAFNYCSGSTSPVTVLNAAGQTGTYPLDIITNINSGAPLSLDLTTGPVDEGGLWYRVTVPLCVTNGTLTCSTTQVYEFYDPDWCTKRAFQFTSVNVTPNTSGTLSLSIANSGLATTYTLRLYLDNGQPVPVLINTHVSPIQVGGSYSYSFPGTYPSGDTYFVEVTSSQVGAGSSKTIVCQTNTIPVAS